MLLLLRYFVGLCCLFGCCVWVGLLCFTFVYFDEFFVAWFVLLVCIVYCCICLLLVWWSVTFWIDFLDACCVGLCVSCALWICFCAYCSLCCAFVVTCCWVYWFDIDFVVFVWFWLIYTVCWFPFCVTFWVAGVLWLWLFTRLVLTGGVTTWFWFWVFTWVLLADLLCFAICLLSIVLGLLWLCWFRLIWFGITGLIGLVFGWSTV